MHTRIWRALAACALLTAVGRTAGAPGGRVVYDAAAPVTTTAAR